MKWLLDLSFRYKIPLWGGLLIIITELAVAGTLMLNAYDDLKENVHVDSEIMGYSLYIESCSSAPEQRYPAGVRNHLGTPEKQRPGFEPRQCDYHHGCRQSVACRSLGPNLTLVQWSPTCDT